MFALAPGRATAWASWLRGPLETVLAPGAWPLAKLSGALRPGRAIDMGHPDASELELVRQRDELELGLARANARIAELEQLVRDLQLTSTVPGREATRPVVANRVGQALGSGTIDVRAGTRDGVIAGDVATARGTQQLVGLVTKAGTMVSTVRLLTDRRIEPGLMQAVIGAEGMRDASTQQSLPRCQLRPDGSGRLIDEQVAAPAGSEVAIRVGALVRLDDATWPGPAQLLTLGRIERVDAAASPQFRKITVRPIVDVSRVSGVILHVPESRGDRDGGTP